MQLEVLVFLPNGVFVFEKGLQVIQSCLDQSQSVSSLRSSLIQDRLNRPVGTLMTSECLVWSLGHLNVCNLTTDLMSNICRRVSYICKKTKNLKLNSFIPPPNHTQTHNKLHLYHLSPPQQHAVLYTGPTIHYTDTHSHKEGTRACNLSNSLMSRKQWREAKCYVTWLLETGSPAKTYRWGHDDVISGYRHHSRVTAQIFSYNHSGRLNVTFSDTISLEWTEKKHKRWYIM